MLHSQSDEMAYKFRSNNTSSAEQFLKLEGLLDSGSCAERVVGVF